MLGILFEALLIAMVIISIIAVEHDNLVAAVIEYSVLNLLFVLILFQLRAPDVALSAIVVGAIITGVYIFTIDEVEKLKRD